MHTLRGPDEISAATITRTKLYNDLRHETGPFDVIGDVHGCRAELEELLAALGYAIARDAAGRAAGARHPGGRRAVFVGDLVDRGPDTPGVLRLVMGMVAAGDAFCVPGQPREQAAAGAARATRSRSVTAWPSRWRSSQRRPPSSGARPRAFLDGLISHYLLDGGRLVVAHAGLIERYQGRASRRVREFCLYGQTTGETDEYGLPVRYPWAQEYRGQAMVLYGHTPVPAPGVGEQHALPGHRLRVRRPADRAALSGARDRRGARGARSTTSRRGRSRRRRIESGAAGASTGAARAGCAGHHRRARHAG